MNGTSWWGARRSRERLPLDGKDRVRVFFFVFTAGFNVFTLSGALATAPHRPHPRPPPVPLTVYAHTRTVVVPGRSVYTRLVARQILAVFINFFFSQRVIDTFAQTQTVVVFIRSARKNRKKSSKRACTLRVLRARTLFIYVVQLTGAGDTEGRDRRIKIAALLAADRLEEKFKRHTS